MRSYDTVQCESPDTTYASVTGIVSIGRPIRMASSAVKAGSNDATETILDAAINPMEKSRLDLQRASVFVGDMLLLADAA